jgi:Fe-S cluster biogenesis protein NfuA
VQFLLKPLRALFGARPTPPGDVPAAGSPRSPLAQDAACEDVTLQHLWSDEPDALKFQINRTLLPFGERRDYATRAEATESPLALAIFEVGGIEAVRLESVYLTVRMDDNADWEGIIQRLPLMLRKFFAAGGQPFAAPAGSAQGGGAQGDGDAETPRRYRFGFKQVPRRSREEQVELVQDLFEKEINPAVAAHGGRFTLLDVQDSTVYVQLGGGCQGCGMANVTLRQGVEARLREVMPELVALVDSTDHASGTNPYYQASKK